MLSTKKCGTEFTTGEERTRGSATACDEVEEESDGSGSFSLSPQEGQKTTHSSPRRIPHVEQKRCGLAWVGGDREEEGEVDEEEAGVWASEVAEETEIPTGAPEEGKEG